jgi:triosephosphate isomerase
MLKKQMLTAPLKINRAAGGQQVFMDYDWIECTGAGSHAANTKLEKAVVNQRQAILCLNEGDQRLAPQETAEVLLQQLSAALKGFSAADLVKLTIVYQPSWSKECWLPADSRRIRVAHRQIRDILALFYNRFAAERCQLVYGGPVLAEAETLILNDVNVDGIIAVQ